MRVLISIGTAFLAGHLFWATAPAEAQIELSPKEVYRASHKSVVTVRKQDSQGKKFRGTGFFVAPRILATNYHVIRNAKRITIEDQNKKLFTVLRVIAHDEAADAALIEVTESSPHFLRLASKSRVEVGDPIYVIGNPRGYERSLSQGLVSAIRPRGASETYQITANVAPGSSGSPVLDEYGHVIGIVFARLGREAQIVFASPASRLAALSENGRPRSVHDSARSVQDSGRSSANGRPAGGDGATVALSPQIGEEKSVAPLGTIRIGLPSWDSARVMAYVLKHAIEELFPVNAELIPGTNAQIFQGINASDRTCDIHPEVWLPNHSNFISDEGHLTEKLYIAVQGLCVPRYVTNRFSLRTRKDLSIPGISRIFDLNGDGRGEIWIGEKGWEASKLQRLMARDFGYAHAFDLFYEDEKSFYERLHSLIAAKKPVVFFCYGPHWNFRRYDLFMLKDPPHRDDCFRFDKGGKDGEWFDRSLAKCALPTSKTHRYYSSYILKKLPSVAAFLNGFVIKYEEVNELVFAMSRAADNGDAVARAWVREHRGALTNLYGRK